MSCPSFKVSVGFPVFGIGFTLDNQLLLAGGGGASRSGVKNKLASYKIDNRRKDLEEDAVFEFKADEDAPMCLDVHPNKPVIVTGVNSSEENMTKGSNDNCRVFTVSEDKFVQEKAFQTLESKKPEDYQRVVRFCEDGSLFVTGTTDGKLNVAKYPELEPLSSPISIASDEILDADINIEKEKLTCVIREKLFLVNLRGKNIGHIVQTISSSDIIKKGTAHFRAFRYGHGFSKDFGYAVLNGVTKPGAYIIKYDAYSLEQKKLVKVSNKPITAFTISRDGAAIAFASADLSVTLLEANSLRKLTKIKDAHSFSITSVAISPDRRLLVSASADNTCRIVSLPLQFGTELNINPLHTLLLACLVAGILLLITTSFNGEPLFNFGNNKESIPKDLLPTPAKAVGVASVYETPTHSFVESTVTSEGNNRNEL